MYANENRVPVLINKSTQAIEPIIPHPGEGKRIAIDYLVLNPSGGNNIVTLTGKIAVPFGLNDNQNIKLSNDIHSSEGIFPMNNDQAFSLTLGSATQVEGYVLYRIING
jgi:hypothetical protein